MLKTHKCIKSHNNTFTFNISEFLNVKNLNTYNLLNDPQTLEPLIQHLSVHDILKFRLISKSTVLTLSNFQKTNTKSELLLDSIKYDCSKCVIDRMFSYSYPNQNAKIFLECIKHKSFKTLKHLVYKIEFNDGGIIMDYPKPEQLLEGGGDKDNFVYQCIIASQKHKPTDTARLLEHITYHFKINLIDMVYPLCINSNKNVFDNMFRNWDLEQNGGYVNKECMMIILHNMCLYGMESEISHNLINVNDSRFLIDLITVNKDIYENNIINILLGRFLMISSQNEHMDDFIELVNDYGNKKVLIDVVKSSFISLDHKKKLIAKAYQLQISSYLTFLSYSSDLNILSIKEAITNGNGEIYTNFLTFQQILSFIMSTDNQDIKERLICNIKNEPYMSGIHVNDMKLIAMWTSDNNKIECIKHLIRLQYLELNIKHILISKIYEQNIEANTRFLMDSEELNILSIKQADKYRSPEQEFTIANCPFTKIYNGHSIYTNKLSIDNILKLIFSVSNKNMKDILIYDLMNKIMLKFSKVPDYDTDEYIIPNCKNYIVIKDTLPNHYKYNNNVNLYDDNTKMYICKPKINEKVLNFDYTKLLLQMDESLYVEIFEAVIKYADGNYRKIQKSIKIIEFLIEHQNFNHIKPSTILKMFNLYDINQIYKMSDTIFNHSFFNKFK
jgi:hypothetical protein